MCVLLVRVQCHYVRAISACAMSLRACYKGVCNVIYCVLLVRVQCHCHPIGGKYAGTATFLPWNSHNPYAGTANASTAIPTSAKKNALEQP